MEKKTRKRRWFGELFPKKKKSKEEKGEPRSPKFFAICPKCGAKVKMDLMRGL